MNRGAFSIWNYFFRRTENVYRTPYSESLSVTVKAGFKNGMQRLSSRICSNSQNSPKLSAKVFSRCLRRVTSYKQESRPRFEHPRRRISYKNEYGVPDPNSTYERPQSQPGHDDFATQHDVAGSSRFDTTGRTRCNLPYRARAGNEILFHTGTFRKHFIPRHTVDSPEKNKKSSYENFPLHVVTRQNSVL